MAKKKEATKQESAQQVAYCLKCKSKQVVKNAQAVVMKNGRDAMRGVCAICSTSVYRIGKMA